MKKTSIHSLYTNKVRNSVFMLALLCGSAKLCASDVIIAPLDIQGPSKVIITQNYAEHAYIVPSVVSDGPEAVVQVEMTGAVDTTPAAGHGCYIADIGLYSGELQILPNLNGNVQGVFVATPNKNLALADISIGSNVNSLILDGSGNAGSNNIIALAPNATKTMVSGSEINLVSQGLDLGEGQMSGLGVLTVNFLKSTGGTPPQLALGHVGQLKALAPCTSLAPGYLAADIGNSLEATKDAILTFHKNNFSEEPLVKGQGVYTNDIYRKFKIADGATIKIQAIA